MIAVIKPSATAEQKAGLVDWIRGQGIDVHISEGHDYTVLGLIGDTSKIDMDLIASLDIVDSVKRVAEPFKQCSRKFHPDDTVVEVGGVKIGGGHFAMIAGPCSVESREQIITVARAVQASGAKLLRGGAFKPRTSPYDFQGLKAEGIELLLEAKKATGMPIVSEIMNANDLPLFEEVDVIQVGARNMQNFDLLKELGRTGKAILLKRGLANTLKELLLSAENIMIGGNARIILCERGIRTFETHTRKHAGSFSGARVARIDALASGGRSQPRDGASAVGGTHGAGGRGLRRGWVDGRSAQQPHVRPVRRRAIAHLRAVR